MGEALVHDWINPPQLHPIDKNQNATECMMQIMVTLLKYDGLDTFLRLVHMQDRSIQDLREVVVARRDPAESRAR